MFFVGFIVCVFFFNDTATTEIYTLSLHASVMLYRTFLLREIPQLIRGTYTRDELEVPGLVVMGADSMLTKLLGLPEPLPNLQVETLPGVGHYVVDEAPEEVMAVLRPFLSATAD